MQSKDFGQMVFTNGHHFAIYRAEAGIDQVGRGSGDLLVGATMPTNTAIGGTNWPRQVSEPLYFWGNTLNGTVTGGETDYPNLIAGRDFTNNAVKPGYVPFTYPHPLTYVTYTNVLGGGGTTTNAGGTTTNVGGTTTNAGGTTTNAGGTTTNVGGTNQLLPPTDLHIIP